MTWEIYGEDKRQEGRQETLKQIVLRMMEQGKTKEETADMTGLTLKEVEAILSEN